MNRNRIERAAPLRQSPAADRNKAPILGVLRECLPPSGRVLEVASGWGLHAAHFAAALPELEWQPSEIEPAALAALESLVSRLGRPNLLAPLELDVRSRWPAVDVDAVVCINMIHIAPWSAAEGLFAGASRRLPPGAPLIVYGPFKRDGRHTAPSNEAFDAALRARDAQWGVRDLARVTAAAGAEGFRLDRVIEMPANNLSIVYRR